MTEERMPWFQCYPSKLLGALAGMQPDEGYVYWVVCLRIYETGKPCRDSVEALARRVGMNRARVLRALELSFSASRLVQNDGGIMNPFAEKVLADASAYRQRRASAGKSGGISSAKKRKENQRIEASNASSLLPANSSHLQLQLQEQVEVRKKDTDSTTENPLEDGTALRPKKAKRTKPRTAIPERAVLVEGDNMDFAISKGFSPSQAREMFVEFRDYHIGKGNLQADWPATWRTWVRNQIKFKGTPNGGLNGKSQGASGGKVGFAGITARLRRGGIAETQRPAPEDLEPVNRR